MLFIQYVLVISTCAQNLLVLGGSSKERKSGSSMEEKGKGIATDNDGVAAKFKRVAADENLKFMLSAMGGTLGGLSIHEKGKGIEAYNKRVAAHKRQYFSPASSIKRNSDRKGKAVTAETNRYISPPSSIGRNSGRPSIEQKGKRVAEYYNEGVAVENERVAAESKRVEAESRRIEVDIRRVFSLEKFASYVTEINNRAVRFQEVLKVVQFMKDPNLRNLCDRKVLAEFILAGAKLPNFSGLDSAIDNQRNKILLLLKEFNVDRDSLIKEEYKFIKEWADNRLHEARSVVQSNFMNGAPDEHTVAVFDGLLPTDLTGVENFLNDAPWFHLRALCEAISWEFHQDKSSFVANSYESPKTPRFPYGFTKREYKMKVQDAGESKVIEKEVYELGECVGNSPVLIYFKVAIAKATLILDKRHSFQMKYLIAFDEIKQDSEKARSWLYETYVAMSFDASLSTIFGSYPQIQLEINDLSLRRKRTL